MKPADSVPDEFPPGRSTRQFRLGDAVVSILCLGCVEADLPTWFAQPSGGWPALHAGDFTHAHRMPVMCVHIALPWASVLVDACDPRAYPAGPGEHETLRQRLAHIGVQASEVSHVVISHGHHDHYCGLVENQGDPTQARLVPTFPRARHILARAEWASGSLCAAATRGDGDSADGQMIGLLAQHGLLDLVEGDQQLVEGIHLINAPGETPGHLVVRLQAGAEPLYLLGDLYHHRAELDDPTLTPWWADAATTIASRAALSERIRYENGLIFCSHICPILRPLGNGALMQSPLAAGCGCAPQPKVVQGPAPSTRMAH